MSGTPSTAPTASGIDVAAKVATRLLPNVLRGPIDQARLDVQMMLEQLRGNSASPTVEDRSRFAALEDISLVEALLPRPMAERIQTARRDVGMIARNLRGERAPHLVPRPPRGSRNAPYSTAPVVPLGGTRGIRPRPMRVTRVVRETSDATSIYLEELDGSPVEFLPGQFLSFDVEVDGDILRRAYSIAAPAGAPGPVHVTVKRVQDGRVSSYLNEYCSAGQTLSVLGPSGAFTWDPHLSDDLVLIAGGSGITPIASIAETALQQHPTCRVTIIFGNRGVADIIFRERLASLETRYAGRLRVDYVLSDPPADWTGGVGLLDAETTEARLSRLGIGTEGLFYVCGPGPMMDAARSVLVKRGVPDTKIREERFHSRQTGETATKLAPQPVTVRSSSGMITTMTETGQTLLEAGLAAGAPMPFSCAMGGCAACKVRLVDGDAVMEEPNCLSATEREAGYVLACVARPTSPCTVEVP